MQADTSDAAGGAHLIAVLSNSAEHAAFLVELVPGAQVVWTCARADFPDDDVPWCEHAARSFDKAVDIASRAVAGDASVMFANAVPTIRRGKFGMQRFGGMMQIADFVSSPDGIESSGYAASLPVERYVRVLGACAGALRSLGPRLDPPHI